MCLDSILLRSERCPHGFGNLDAKCYFGHSSGYCTATDEPEFVAEAAIEVEVVEALFLDKRDTDWCCFVEQNEVVEIH